MGQASACPFSIEEKGGFIDVTTEDGAIIMLTRPSDSHILQTETPVTLRSRSRGEPTATAEVCGLITEVGYVAAAFRVAETRTDAQCLRASRSCAGVRPSAKPCRAALSKTRPGPSAGNRRRASAAWRRSVTRPKAPQPEGARKPSRNGARPTE